MYQRVVEVKTDHNIWCLPGFIKINKSVPGKGYFMGIRLYSPTQAFFDQTWILPDIEKATK
jgi:hypothetical protein